VADDAASVTAARAWMDRDDKAKSDLLLAIHPSELKQVKGCEISRDVWIKLENTYQSKGSARKATLLKQLTLHKMKDGTTHEDSLTQWTNSRKWTLRSTRIYSRLCSYTACRRASRISVAQLSRANRSSDARDVTHQNHRGIRCQKERMRYGRGTRCANN